MLVSFTSRGGLDNYVSFSNPCAGLHQRYTLIDVATSGKKLRLWRKIWTWEPELEVQAVWFNLITNTPSNGSFKMIKQGHKPSISKSSDILKTCPADWYHYSNGLRMQMIPLLATGVLGQWDTMTKYYYFGKSTISIVLWVLLPREICMPSGPLQMNAWNFPSSSYSCNALLLACLHASIHRLSLLHEYHILLPYVENLLATLLLASMIVEMPNLKQIW